MKKSMGRESSLIREIYVAFRSFGGEISFRLALHLLRFDLRRHDGMMYHVWSVDGIDGRHPGMICQHKPMNRFDAMFEIHLPVIYAQREVLIEEILLLWRAASCYLPRSCVDFP